MDLQRLAAARDGFRHGVSKTRVNALTAHPSYRPALLRLRTAPSRNSLDSEPLVATDLRSRKFPEKIPGGHEDCGAGRGWFHGAAGADEEGSPEFRFQRPDTLGQSGGRRIKTPGRFGK
jgi:hypothetical protein